MEHIDTPIKVGAIFERGKISPAWFIWEGRKYTVKGINYFWKRKEGQNTIYFFSVTEGENNFELAFYIPHLTWKLEKILS